MKQKDEPVIEEQDEAALALQQAATLMAKAAEDRVNRPAIMKEVENALSKLRIVDFPELAESPVVQSFLRAMDTSAMRPGETRNRGTLAEVARDWSMEALSQEVREGRMTLRRFVPVKDMVISWNGVRLGLPANEEVEVPEVFYAEYRRVMEAEKQARLHEHYLLGHSDVAPHPNTLSENSARVRAWSLQGRPYGRPGGTLSTGRISESSEKEGG